MIDRDHNLDGEHGIELVAYMYGELDHDSRTAFETHLAGCDECAFELASFAGARLSVIEWRREDFDPLATPVILVPETEQVTAFADRPTPAGIFKGFWDAVLSFPLAARVGASLAAASLVAAIVYFAAFSDRQSAEVANQNRPQGVIGGPSAEAPKEPTPDVARYKPAPEPKQLKPEKIIDRHPIAHVQLASTRNALRSSSKIVQPKVQTASTRAPRLNNLEEEEDKSLRLADLFAEIGSSEE